MDIVIYSGIAINVIGAILLLVYSVRYYALFKESEKLPVKRDALKAQWQRKRAVGFGLMIGGTVVAIIGCYL